MSDEEAVDALTDDPLEWLRAQPSRPGIPPTRGGRIEPGASADLVLVDGDPTSRLSSTLNTRAVWRRGHRPASAG
ncbi:hypothetical protein PS467_39520 [Streptomyces luomodiensis]|uniref:Amidohydrolase-related domain-containing protein n=1 Tax=Streptomyces luomodiensis TaxID=3026192 RepID=A0ABY9VGN2_9ACTN|nr:MULTISPECIES: hypothetical protein [unclassified Streptomyces]WAP61126.1 hypothetical protein N6H00_38280 [Streptomyces sp. S465]WNF01876.1 hypothetical protein PS467_39520 [Streptomyces sp. SCA4-21]